MSITFLNLFELLQSDSLEAFRDFFVNNKIMFEMF
jgi:hypothetical protein